MSLFLWSGPQRNADSVRVELRQQSRSYYVTTNDIFSNHWSDPIYIDGLGYDPDLLIDDDGTAYITRTDINNPVEKVSV